eukprot:7384784-Prymnesium_polylepis.2
MQRATDITQQDQRQVINIHQSIGAWRRVIHALVRESGKNIVFVHCHAPAVHAPRCWDRWGMFCQREDRKFWAMDIIFDGSNVGCDTLCAPPAFFKRASMRSFKWMGPVAFSNASMLSLKVVAQATTGRIAAVASITIGSRAE